MTPSIPGHDLGHPEQVDTLPRWRCVCECGLILREASMEDLALVMVMHLVEVQR